MDDFAVIPDEALDSPWRDADLARLTLHIVSWEELAPFWGLTEAEEEVIKRDNSKYAAQKLAALRRWKTKNPETATYRQLVRVFGRMGRVELVEKVREIVLNPEEVPTGGLEDVLCSYREFLGKNYNQLPHPGMLTDQWPIMKSPPAYVPLALTKEKPRSQRRHMEHLPTGRSFHLPFRNLRLRENDSPDVHLSELFSERSVRTAVIKGFPGSGKTTLTWHATQQWAKGELFQQFSLLLSIPLRSTRVQQATCLADLIPHPDREQRKAIAQAISACNGEGVCFWFDGWDEMPQEVQRESFIASFIRRDCPGSSLPECVTVVTARPEASYLEMSRVMWINGLSTDQVNEIIEKSLEGTDRNPSELIASLEKNTSLQSACFVPINIAIMISLFLTLQSGLPNTQTELFNYLVLSLLLRNLQMRWKLGITSLKTFSALPEAHAQFFKAICGLAFDGIMKNKTVFFRPDLHTQQVLPLSTLGLMKINPRMEWHGIEEELTFLHTTLQEFLAAVHLTTLESKEQVKIVRRIVESMNWYQQYILQFYAGLTHLSNKEVFAIILQKCCVSLNPGGLFSDVYMETEGSSLSSFITFVNCAFEAQAAELCQELTPIRTFNKKFNLNLRFDFGHFNTTDLSDLGYFLGWFCQKKTCELTFCDCFITPQQIRMFVDQVKPVWNNELHRPSLSLVVSSHHISPSPPLSDKSHYKRVEALCELIKDTTLVSQFYVTLAEPDVQPSVHIMLHNDFFSAMKYLIEAFVRNTSCTSWTIEKKVASLEYLFGILPPPSPVSYVMSATYSDYYAALLITSCKYIKKIAFHGFFDFGCAYQAFACALQHNTNVRYLDLSQNKFLDEAIANIAHALRFNTTIKVVNFTYSLQSEEVALFMNYFGSCRDLPPVNSGLNTVLVDAHVWPGKMECETIKAINERRKRIQPRRCLFMVVTCVETDEDENGWAHCIKHTGFDTKVILGSASVFTQR